VITKIADAAGFGKLEVDIGGLNGTHEQWVPIDLDIGTTVVLGPGVLHRVRLQLLICPSTGGAVPGPRVPARCT
jgi:hypothetical protein